MANNLTKRNRKNKTEGGKRKDRKNKSKTEGGDRKNKTRKNKSKTEGGKRKLSPGATSWMKSVMDVRKELGCSLKDAMKEAAKRKKKGQL